MTFGDHLSADKIRECMEAARTIIAKFYATIKTSFRDDMTNLVVPETEDT